MTSLGTMLADGEPLPPCHDRGQSPGLDLAVLYRSEAPKLVGQLSRRIQSDRAHDVVQRVFVRMIARFGSGETPPCAPTAYLRETTRNVLRDDARVAARCADDCHEALDEQTIAGTDPIALLEARDRLMRIETAVRRLKPLTRQIFLARRIDGYSYEEIARRTGLSVKGVEKQMSRALRQLGRHLRDG